MSEYNEDTTTEKVIVAIDKNKGSQFALKWAIENILSRGDTVTLLHVIPRSASITSPHGIQVISDGHQEEAKAFQQHLENQAKEIFLPFRCFCSRKDIKAEEMVVESPDTAKAIIDFANFRMADNIVLGASNRSSLIRRFKGPDIPTLVSKGAPDFTSVYIIAKGKVVSSKSASHSYTSPSTTTPATPSFTSPMSSSSGYRPSEFARNSTMGDRSSSASSASASASSRLTMSAHDMDTITSPFNRCHASNGISYGDLPPPESDISFVTSGRSSTDRPQSAAARLMSDGFDFGSRISSASSDSERMSLGGSSLYSGYKFLDMTHPSCGDISPYESSFTSSVSGMSSISSSSMDDVESQMWRLRQELKQTMDMYNAACKEAVTAQKKAMEEDNKRAEQQSRLAQETAIEKEKQKSKAAQDAAEAAQKLAQMEAQKRMIAQTKAREEQAAEEKHRALVKSLPTTTDSPTTTTHDPRYRRYSIEEIEVATDYFSESRMIGSGGYGPVYKSTLDHTQVAIKVLRPDAAQGKIQFDREVEILSSIRHPNMVILLGACPEFGCLVYEYMSNGSLEDRLFCKNNTPPLPWQIRFRIACEIGTSLHFLHQTKPEPLVHRDLKPANILLDRNFVSKISDVGLARLVPPSVADSVTHCRMTQAAGTFCYIDPEYQQTGMLRVKSDVYSLGVLFLQLITGMPAMGLMHKVEMAIEDGELTRVLDPAVEDWPMEETAEFAEMALKCAELRSKDRPDLGKVILPLLERLRDFAEDNMAPFFFGTPAKVLRRRLTNVRQGEGLRDHDQSGNSSSNVSF